MSCEPNLYGFTVWLAKYLNCARQNNIRGYQHGWIWWERERGSYDGFDPHFRKPDGLLVQNEQIAQSLRDEGVYAKAVGLPFLTYKNYSGQKLPDRRPETLFVPTHSNAWYNATKTVFESCEKQAAKGYAVMLGVEDYNPNIAGFEKVEMGAGVFDNNSFARLFEIFHSYEYMVTDTIGSHIAYGLSCGMKVKLLQDSKALESKYPGITTDWHFGEIDVANEPPEIIATELGWKI